MDLSFLSNEELAGLQKGDYAKLSNESLSKLQQQSQPSQSGGSFGDEMSAFPKFQPPPAAQQRLSRLDQLTAYRDSLDPASKEAGKVTTEIDKEHKALIKEYPQLEQSTKQSGAASDAKAAISKLGIFTNEFKRMQDAGFISPDTLSPGPIRGLLNKFEGAIQTNPVEPSFNGSKTEMAASLAKLITGGSRPPGNISEGIVESLPGDFSSWGTFANKMGLQFQNALAQRAADENLDFNQDTARKNIVSELKKYMPADEATKFETSFLGSKLNPQQAAQAPQPPLKATKKYNPLTGKLEDI